MVFLNEIEDVMQKFNIDLMKSNLISSIQQVNEVPLQIHKDNRAFKMFSVTRIRLIFTLQILYAKSEMLIP